MPNTSFTARSLTAGSIFFGIAPSSCTHKEAAEIPRRFSHPNP